MRISDWSSDVCSSDLISTAPDHRLFGVNISISSNGTVFIADTAVNERPPASQLVDIAIQTAELARRFGHEPRVAFLRSEERRVGKAWVRTCRSRWSQSH